MSLDNSIMSEIYPYGGFWAYLKYHFIDGMTKQSLMLLDKTRTEYTGKSTKEGSAGKFKVKSHSSDELKNLFGNFGIGVNLSDEDKAKIISNELEG